MLLMNPLPVLAPGVEPDPGVGGAVSLEAPLAGQQLEDTLFQGRHVPGGEVRSRAAGAEDD